jgi:CheY-like chemotaxis protein
MARRDSPLILLAEDNENDVLMFRRASRKANFDNPIQVVADGEEVIAYLSGEGKFASRDRYPLPGLVLLDLKMPRKNGFDVLRWVRQQREFADLQIVVLTTSDEIKDINRAYELGANSFLVKPVAFSEFVGMLEALHSYCVRVWSSNGKPAAVPVSA